MIKEIIATGPNVEAAIESGVEKLGTTRDMVEIQVISLPKKGFLGLFGGSPAKVRVYMEVAEEVAKPQPAFKPQNAAPKKQEPKQHAPKANEPKAPKQEKPAEPQKEKPAETKEPKTYHTVDLSVEGQPVEEGSKGALARDYLNEVIKNMGIDDIEVSATTQGEVIVLKLLGESNGLIIGKRGETLDALQYLSSLAANKIDGEYARVVIDSGNYRERRQQTLENLAKKISSTVLKTGRGITLEPMNPYERRVIHSTVGDIEGVKSTSIGDEPNRRVFISVEGSTYTPNPNRRFQGSKPHGRNNKNGGDRRDGGKGRFNKGGHGGHGGHGGRDGNRRPHGKRNDSPSPSQQPNPNREKPTEANNAPIYGKIDL